MLRDIIQIDEEKCNGCGLCISACHEGALALVGGKARLISESYCDGLGACLPECPAGAIQVVQSEAAEFVAPAPGAGHDEHRHEHQRSHLKGKKTAMPETLACGCPGSQARSLPGPTAGKAVNVHQAASPIQASAPPSVSELRQWPVQIKLVPAQAPYLNNARLLIAADCAAYARASFHEEFIRGRITLIGCPKLDAVDYAGKLADIFTRNNIRNVLVVRMEVPCCGGLEHAVRQALQTSGRMIPWQVVTLGTDGAILED